MKRPKPQIVLLVDSREQRPFALPDAVRCKLDTGDYGVMRDGVLLPAAIERKSIGDLLGVIGGQRERFERELERARHLRYFGIVIEGTRSMVLREIERRAEGLGGRLTASQVMGSLAAWDTRGVHVHFEEDRLIAAAWTRMLLIHIAKNWTE